MKGQIIRMENGRAVIEAPASNKPVDEAIKLAMLKKLMEAKRC
jgi:hypothetical protein